MTKLKINQDRLWLLKKFSDGGWKHGPVIIIGVKKWALHMEALVKMGLIEPDPNGGPLHRITNDGVLALQSGIGR